MSKRFVFLLSFFAIIDLMGFSEDSFARDKLSVPDEYNRNSVSFVVVTHGDKYDQLVINAVKAYSNEKFDYNEISIKTIPTSLPRLINPTVKSVATKVKPLYSKSDLLKTISSYDYGKEIFSFWTMRDSEGKMYDTRILERGRYNATKEDLADATASKVGAEWVAEKGYELISKSYVVVVDCYAIGNYDISGQVIPCASLSAIIYKMDITEDQIDNIFSKAWISDSDSPKQIKKKLNYYANSKIKCKERLFVENFGPSMLSMTKSMGGSMVKSASGVDLSSSAEEGISKVLVESIDNLMDNPKMTEWKVAAPMTNIAPIESPIGKKEGLRNGHRYTIFKYIEKRNGELIPVKVGYARALNRIPDNRVVVSDTISVSPARFIQLSGIPASQGMMLLEDKDHKMKSWAAFGVHDGGAGFNTGLSFLLYTHSSKHNIALFSHYADLTFEIGKGGYLQLDYGFGMRLLRYFEFVPYFGAELSLTPVLVDEAKNDPLFGICGGLTMNTRLIYPIDFFVRMGFSTANIVNFSTGLKFDF